MNLIMNKYLKNMVLRVDVWPSGYDSVKILRYWNGCVQVPGPFPNPTFW